MERDKRTDFWPGKPGLGGGASSRVSVLIYPETILPLSRLRGNNVSQTSG